MLFHLVSVFRLVFFFSERPFCRPGYCLNHLSPLMCMCVANSSMTHQHNDTRALIAGYMDLFNPVSYLIVMVSFAVSLFCFVFFFITLNGTQVNPGWVLPFHDIF